jgi:hypothetical protein
MSFSYDFVLHAFLFSSFKNQSFSKISSNIQSSCMFVVRLDSHLYALGFSICSGFTRFVQSLYSFSHLPTCGHFVSFLLWWILCTRGSMSSKYHHPTHAVTGLVVHYPHPLAILLVATTSAHLCHTLGSLTSPLSIIIPPQLTYIHLPYPEFSCLHTDGGISLPLRRSLPCHPHRPDSLSDTLALCFHWHPIFIAPSIAVQTSWRNAEVGRSHIKLFGCSIF